MGYQAFEESLIPPIVDKLVYNNVLRQYSEFDRTTGNIRLINIVEGLGLKLVRGCYSFFMNIVSIKLRLLLTCYLTIFTCRIDHMLSSLLWSRKIALWLYIVDLLINRIYL